MYGGGPYMVKAVARRLNGGGPCMVVVHMCWGKTSQNGKTVPVVKNDTGGENVTSGQNVAAWTTCHIVESVSLMNCHTRAILITA